jgi:hypothetical protein
MLDMDSIYAIFGKWIALEDKRLVDILAGFWLAHKLGGDPIWAILMGPSSGGKTEMLRAFSSVDSVEVSAVTPRTIVSGRERNEETGEKITNFGRELNGKIWVVMDFSEILAKSAEDRKKIFATMRSLYDGRLTAYYGTGKKVHEEDLYVSFIAASTSAFEKEFLEHQALGTRHLVIRIPEQPKEMVKLKLKEHEGKEKVMRASMRSVVDASFVAADKLEWFRPSGTIETHISNLTDILCTLRTYVSIDRYKNEVDELPEPEMIGRARKNINKFYAGLMNIDGFTPRDALERIAYIVKSNIPRMRLRAIEKLTNQDSEILTAMNLSKELRVGYKTAVRHLDSLYSLSVLDRPDKGLYMFNVEWQNNYGCWFKEEGI